MAYQSGHALEELSTLVAVVEAGGFTAAASRHGMRKGTLSLRVKSLEERLGVKLLARTTRSLRLTEEGQAFYEHAARAVQAASDAEGAVERAKGSPIGKLKVSTTAGLAGIILETAVIEYLRRYPKVALDLDTSSRKVDLMREDFDLALRVGAQEDSPLVQRRLGIARGGYFASRARGQRRGHGARNSASARILRPRTRDERASRPPARAFHAERSRGVRPGAPRRPRPAEDTRFRGPPRAKLPALAIEVNGNESHAVPCVGRSTT
jgi:DNA-binding transcriptional LysR family regulator